MMPATTARGPLGVVQVVLSLGTGGTERLVVELCQRLQCRFRMTVCALDEPGGWAPELQLQGVDVVPLFRRPGFRPALGYQIAQIASRYHASIVHCHHYSPFVYGQIATMMRPGLRLVFTEHGRLSDEPATTKRRLVNPLLGRLPGSLFAVSGALRDSMVEDGFPAGRIQVVHNGIDPGRRVTEFDRRSIRTKHGLRVHSFVIGTIARLDPVKDLGTLIEAFELVRRRSTNAILAIVGDGIERGRLEGLARRLHVADFVRFLGARDDARRFLPGFDAYVNSSTSEGVSLTILEAMAAELPVVATHVGGPPEEIVDQHTGVLVPARSPAALAAALDAIAIDPARRRALGQAARLAVEQQFTIDRMVEHYAQVYMRQAN